MSNRPPILRAHTIGFVEYTDQRSDLLRILLADDDDVHAFTVQCAIHRLSKPCAFLRAENLEILGRKVRSFEPELLVVSGAFATPEELRRIREMTGDSPIICLAKNPEDAEENLRAGATDCILLSQENRLGECLEKHLTGTFSEPDFRSKEPVEPKRRMRRVEEKLEQLDRKIAAHLRELARTTVIQWGHFKQATKVGYSAGRAWVLKHYRELKAKYLLRKQQRLMQAAAPAQNRVSTGATALSRAPVSSETKIPLEIEIAQKIVPNGDGAVKIHMGDVRGNTLGTAATPMIGSRFGHETSGDEESRDALRAMELSFKTLFHSALDATFLLDGLGSILHVNRAGCALLGAEASELLGKTFLSFVASSQSAQASATWEALLIEGQQRTDLVVETVSGEQREVFVSARANLWFGVHLLVARDQTELKRLRAEVGALR